MSHLVSPNKNESVLVISKKYKFSREDVCASYWKAAGSRTWCPTCNSANSKDDCLYLSYTVR